MTTKIRDEGAEVIRFGGGINSRASEDQIDPIECTAGQNFVLDPGNGEFKRRPPFDLVGTAPNGAAIRGAATLQKADGTVTMLVQAGATVYSWDGASTFTSVGTVNASSKLRGPREANWILADKVLIADLALLENVLEWDGTTLSTTSFFEADGSTAFANFKAKYIVVENERAYYANIDENSNSFPHLLVASKRGDYTVVGSSGGAFPDSQRPSSSLGAADAWFLPTPQLKPINGMQFVFGLLAISQEDGAFEKLTGSDATDFALQKLYQGSGAAGVESVITTENDVIYGAKGRIESLISTDKFGDVELDDLSFKIKPDVKTYKEWTLVYNPQVKRVYCFPANTSEVWVLHTEFIGSELSPWSKFTTNHAMAFQPTMVMLLRDPTDGLEYVFMGDGSGNLYRMEGTGTAGDGANSIIDSKRTSVLFGSPLDAKLFHVNGWLTQRKRFANTANLRFIFSGENVQDILASVAFDAVNFTTVYGGSAYYGGNYFYGPEQENRLVRKLYGAPGEGNRIQVEIAISGINDFAISECGVRFDFAG